MDAEGEVLTPQGDRSVAGFNETLTALEAYLVLKEKADSGDKSVANDLFLAELRLGKIGLDEAKVRHGRLKGLSDEQNKEIAAEMLVIEVSKLINKVQTRQMTPNEVSAQFAEMATAGRIPAGSTATIFWSAVLSHADQKEDAKLYEKALIGLKEVVGDNESNADMFARYEQRLKELKGG